ncbi:MAG: hypothetical protein R6W96_05485, partial [Clostridia bacterium]
FIFLFGRIMNMDKRKRIIVPLPEVIQPEQDVAGDELVAVIAAAVSAFLDSGHLAAECEIKVRSFKRTGSNSPVWNQAGRNELVQSHLS